MSIRRWHSACLLATIAACAAWVATRRCLCFILPVLGALCLHHDHVCAAVVLLPKATLVAYDIDDRVGYFCRLPERVD
jgi:hypothetical protein